MKKIIFLIFSIALLIGCSNDDDNPSEVNIRLSNVSLYNFENIVVNTSTGRVDFENMDAGQKTDYKTFETAYSYAFIELVIEGKTYTLQPIDYVGETPLVNGNYTYQLDADDTQEQYGKLYLTLIEE